MQQSSRSIRDRPLIGQGLAGIAAVPPVAMMQIHGIKRFLSFDLGFDGFPGITRLS